MSLVRQDTSKEVRYLNRDFDQLKAGLIDFAKRYYPSTYNDFNEASPGMMFIEMAAYVGDVLNYYIDSQLKESLITQARERKNLLDLAQAFGYKPKISVPATVDIDVYQYMRATNNGLGVDAAPDEADAIKLAPGTILASSYNGTQFIIQEEVDFSVDTYVSPRTISVAEIDPNDGSVLYYLAKKTYKAISATVNTMTVTFEQPQKYAKILVGGDNIIGVQDIVDSDGNRWYEVGYLAQDTIFEKVLNTPYNNNLYTDSASDPQYLAKLLRVPRRYITRTTERGIEVQFGAGVSSSPGEELLPTPENLSLSLPTGVEQTDTAYDPTSPLFTSAYGQAPSYTTLTVTYLTGGGVQSNVPSNTITTLAQAVFTSTNDAAIANSLAFNNPSAATGGRSKESNEEIRQNTMAQFASQQRAVTRNDYILRAYSMPATYGSVAKAFITPDDQENLSTSVVGDRLANPLALNMYLLGYDADKRLIPVNDTVKRNLKTYLGQYRMVTDSINFRDAFIVNIEVNLSIILYPGYNAGEAIANCIKELKEYFDTDKWQINQPIIYSDIYTKIMGVKGVQMISSLGFVNLHNEILGYSNAIYDLADATRNGIVYPSYDPCIFEVRYPDNDIKVRVAAF